jgi:hypothetical protein
MKNPLCVVLALMLLATACATTRLRTEFDDVPLPTGLTYQPQRSVVIESPAVKAAKLVYRGRLEPASLGLAMRAMLESNGWRHVNTTTAAKDGTRQVYEKRGNALEIHISEGFWFTYLVIGISETLLTATSQIEPRTPSAGVATVSDQERIASPAKARVDASPRPASILETPPPSERTTASAEPSFAQRVRDFFTSLFSR